MARWPEAQDLVGELQSDVAAGGDDHTRAAARAPGVRVVVHEQPAGATDEKESEGAGADRHQAQGAGQGFGSEHVGAAVDARVHAGRHAGDDEVSEPSATRVAHAAGAAPEPERQSQLCAVPAAVSSSAALLDWSST